MGIQVLHDSSTIKYNLLQKYIIWTNFLHRYYINPTFLVVPVIGRGRFSASTLLLSAMLV